MKKQIRPIIALILIANLAIILFQGYWLNSSYQINKKRFEQIANNTLQHTVMQAMIFDSRRIMFDNDSLEFSFKSKITDPLPPHFVATSDHFSASNLQEMTFFTATEPFGIDTGKKVKSRHRIKAIFQKDSVGNKEDLLEIKLDNIIDRFMTTLIEQQLDLEEVDSLYSEELKRQGIYIPHFLNYYKEDSLVLSTIEEEKNAAYMTPLAQISLSTANKLYGIKAGFPNPYHYIFSQMWGALLASFLLIILTIGSFAYLLRVIFQQKRLSEIKNDFINNMTHEFKTPISIIAATNEALTRFNVLEDRAKTKRYLNISKNELTRLSGMVEKVLNIAQYEKEDFELDLEEVNLDQLLQSVTNRYRLTPNDNATITYQNQLKQTTLSLDAVHFTNVLNNLLDNALKYSKAKTTILIHAFEDAKNIIIQIKDNGIGVSKTHQKLIFDKFYRVPTGDLHNIKGFGLGLSYVKKMVEKHGGIVQVESEIEKGSTFSICLPKVIK